MAPRTTAGQSREAGPLPESGPIQTMELMTALPKSQRADGLTAPG